MFNHVIPYHNLAKLMQLGIPLMLLAVTHYFLIVRPQHKKTQQCNELEKKLCIGSSATTTSGIVGVILFVDHHSVILDLASGEKIEVLKSSIAHVENQY